MKKGGNFFMGIIIGTITGLAMGIMFYPRKENKFKNIFNKKTETLKENLQNIKKKIGKKIDTIKSDFEIQWKKHKNKNDIDKIEDELGT
ncbi:YtxH domain-containing protein [Blattabacterium cuenoti]|uniref:YtxH domain-containing protein n=1 Tax=Blattabacterium cuenoti TaxID=1653831 RepID=UPI00163CDE30|nr:YtxH domain-containing protein [Blattabacterium cuenoti]